MSDPNTPKPTPASSIIWVKLALILVCVILAGYVLNHIFHGALNTVGTLNSIGPPNIMSAAMMTTLLLYAVLIAVPFMPGIEVGVALLLLFGARIAPFVYLATLCGLLTAYLCGRFVPLNWLKKVLQDLHLNRAAQFITEIQTTTPQERLQAQRERLPAWLGKMTVDYRYISIGVLLNVPGTFAIGGGGGIMMTAGFSRVFKLGALILTLMIATLPVPLMVWLSGTPTFGPH